MNPPALRPNLGKPLQEFATSSAAFWKIGLLGAVSAGVAALIFYGSWFGRGIGLGGRIVLSIVAALFALPAVAALYMLVTRRGSSITLYQHGLVYRRAGKESAARWDEIASYTESSACRIAKRDGEVFEFGGNVEGFEAVADVVRQETLDRLLPVAEAAVRRGEELRFPGLKAEAATPLSGVLNKTLLGAEGFTVNARGISAAGHNLAWPQVVEFGISRGEGRQAAFDFLFVRDAAQCLEMNYGLLPNAHVLLALCEAMAPPGAAPKDSL